MLPPVLSLYITNFCQLKCPHCFLTRNRLLNTNMLSYQDIVLILDDARTNKVFLVPISGGDPLLHPDVFKIIKAVFERRMLPLLGITGMGVDQPLAQKIKDHGVPCVQVSLDGPNGPANDSLRGRDNFGEVIKSIENLNRTGVKTNLSICITKRNADTVLLMLDLARRLNIYKLKLAFWQPSGDETDAHVLSLTEDQKAHIADQCISYQRHNRLENWIASPNAEFTSINPSVFSEKYPPITVHPNGDFTVSELGPKIGHVRYGVPSFFYKLYLERSCKNEARV